MSIVNYNNQNSFKKVDRIDLKRTYVISQLIRDKENKKIKYLDNLTKEEFDNRLLNAKHTVLSYSEKELDEYIFNDAPGYKRRLKFYNSMQWYYGSVNIDEVGVWKGAGRFTG